MGIERHGMANLVKRGRTVAGLAAQDEKSFGRINPAQFFAVRELSLRAGK